MDSVEVRSGPTKRFFVEMLTRDIELQDAILDLLDNCIDGVIRTVPKPDDPDRRYEGFWARITTSKDYFEITDNCGGIPEKIAKESAFVLGRPADRNEKLETVGMYGIGMKRAIFKIGREAVVISQPKRTYQVRIPPKWFSDEKSWVLQMDDTEERLAENGTSIRITKVLPEIGVFLDSGGSFLNDLKNEISRFYSVIMQKGFRVFLNDEEILPAPVRFKFAADFNDVDTVRPYVFKANFGDVDVHVGVGLYRALASLTELENEERAPQQGTSQAGWTVICNDRVVLYGDKSVVTGWGTGGVPQYHPQFRAIAGVVTFRSENPYKLPLKTTKRGLEVSNPIYLRVLDKMRDGTKLFTQFTNRWKALESEANKTIEKAQEGFVEEMITKVPDRQWKSVRQMSEETGGTAKEFKPKLPEPEHKKRLTRIQFHRPPEDVELLGRHLFDDPEAGAQEVGELCFDLQLEEAKKARSG